MNDYDFMMGIAPFDLVAAIVGVGIMMFVAWIVKASKRDK